jgi:hypothetical protein
MSPKLQSASRIAVWAFLAFAALPAMAAESLPMPVARYAELCMASGGAMTAHLSSGVGIVRCTWSDHGRTECKVGANTVSICGISCQSTVCLKANPARYTPKWPLAGGPSGAALPVSPGSGTLAPSN